MKRAPTLARCTPSGAVLPAMAVALPLLLFVPPVQAQNGPQIDLYGYVAPRCWVARSAPFQPAAETAAPRPRVICNQAVPRLSENIRALGDDGMLVQRVQPAAAADRAAQLSGRTAMEILVSPRI